EKMRDTPWYTLLILLTVLMKVAEVRGQCGRPSVGENIVMISDFSNQTFPNGSTITFKCSTGYVPVNSLASRTIICVGTEWTKLDLNCTKKSCGPLPDIPNGKYTYPDGNLFGATAVAECNEGYLLVGEKTRNCRESGWDGRDPVCEVVKCEPPPTIQNGTYDPIEEFYNYNQAVTYSCSKDYTLVGESTIACLANGSFPSPPQCLLVQCETPNITNAVRVEGKSPPYGYRDFVRYECNKGYIMKGEGYLVCDVNGWNPSPPECIKASCGPLPDIPNGKYTYPDGNLLGATAVAECNEGYLLVGEKTRNCRESGWDGRDPVCEVVKCEPPPTIQNGTYDPIEEFYNYNQAVTYSCSKDYTLVGESTIACLANGSFPSPPQCLLVQCETPNITNAVRVEGKSPPYGYRDFVRYKCNTGYTMKGEGYLVCDLNGWNPPPPECNKKSCGSLPDILNGKYTYPDGNLFGATAVAECNEGYSLVGDKNRNCHESGWDGGHPECKATDSSTTFHPSYGITIIAFLVSIVLLAQCGKHSVGENMISEPAPRNEYPEGFKVTFSCSTGYVAVSSGASRSITCERSQWTTLALQCKKKTCGSPGEVSNGKYLAPDGIEFGAIITVQCNEGYMAVGPQRRSCLANGWDGRAAVCEQTKCLPPPKIQYGVYEPEDETYGYNEAVTYSCSGGKTLIGESTITCSSDGTFQPPPPQCLLITCDKPDIKNAGRVRGKSSFYGYKDFVQYECNEGYTMEGEDYLVCDVNGWNPPPPKCIEKSCGSLVELPNGKYLTPGGILFGAIAFAQCNEGFRLSGPKTRTCQDDGWDGRQAVCEVVKCKSPDVKNAVRVEGKSPPYGYKDFVRYECKTLYKMKGTGNLTCEVNGWNPPPPECI
ncbi:sushi, von Willebrand factor type A, EGF and pentraxin domain-containing protein 1-like isoform X1, partial [Clarias magur]